MKDKYIIITTIFVGLAIFELFEITGNSPIPGGILAAIITGVLLGKKLETDSIKYTLLSIFIYNTLGWILIFLITPDGKAVVQSGTLLIFTGFILVSVLIYAVIGSFAAFVTSGTFSEGSD
jgi:hypothetical protein